MTPAPWCGSWYQPPLSAAHTPWRRICSTCEPMAAPAPPAGPRSIRPASPGRAAHRPRSATARTAASAAAASPATPPPSYVRAPGRPPAPAPPAARQPLRRGRTAPAHSPAQRHPAARRGGDGGGVGVRPDGKKDLGWGCPASGRWFSEIKEGKSPPPSEVKGKSPPPSHCTSISCQYHSSPSAQSALSPTTRLLVVFSAHTKSLGSLMLITSQLFKLPPK